MKHRVFIAIGSNKNNPLQQCQTAVDYLRKTFTLIQQSSFYKTEAMVAPGKNKNDFDDYINAVCKIETSMRPRSVLNACLQIEKKMGRKRIEKWGPRIIDLDILFYDELIIHKDGLEIPHPGISQRRFVLEPLSEIAAQKVHPQIKKTIQELKQQTEDQSFCIPIKK